MPQKQECSDRDFYLILAEGRLDYKRFLDAAGRKCYNGKNVRQGTREGGCGVPQEHYSLIYRFFRARIEFGFYQKGDCLPTIELLHEVYQVAVRTVRSAYLRLQAEGYIRLCPGRKTVVVWDGVQTGAARCQAYYLARRDGFRQLQEVLPPFVLPLLAEGARRLPRREMARIEAVASSLEDGDYYLMFFCGRCMLQTLGSGVLLNFYDELADYYQFSFLWRRGMQSPAAARQLQTLVRGVRAACRTGDREQLRRAYLEMQVLLCRTVWDDLG